MVEISGFESEIDMERDKKISVDYIVDNPSFSNFDDVLNLDNYGRLQQ